MEKSFLSTLCMQVSLTVDDMFIENHPNGDLFKVMTYW